MTLRERYANVIATLQQKYGYMDTELNYNSPFQLLIATVLSAQCTDKRVNAVTPELFQAFPTPQQMSEAPVEEIFEYIKSVSYPNSKAKYLQGIGSMLTKDFNSEVPHTLEDLVKLPGVGRKTANVVQAFAFGKETLAVDTHVFRVSHRLGLVPERCTTPLSVEKYLVQHLPKDRIALSHSWILLQGRYVCKSQRPQCEKCELTAYCKTFEKQHKHQ